MEDQSLETLLSLLKTDVEYFNESIREAAEDVLTSGATEYPVFIAHQEEIAFGEELLSNNQYPTHWSISLTSLEELEERGMFDKEGKAKFKSTFKDPHEHMCILVATPALAKFVFIPYKPLS